MISQFKVRGRVFSDQDNEDSGGSPRILVYDSGRVRFEDSSWTSPELYELSDIIYTISHKTKDILKL